MSKLSISKLKEIILDEYQKLTKYDALLDESGILYKAGVKKYGKEGMKKIQQAAGKKLSHAAIGAIKDKYEKGKKDEGKLNEEKPYETILKQLGGNKFIAMTGAKNLGTSTKKDLSFYFDFLLCKIKLIYSNFFF